MKEKIRKIGLDIIPEAPWGTHLCLFYQTKEDLIDILVPYFKTGLENNEFCMWVTSEPLKVEEAKAILKKRVRNLDKYIKKGQIEILDYSQWYTKSGKFESDKVLQGCVKKEKEALKRGFDGLRLTENTLWLEKKDWKNFTDYEEAVNNLIGKYRMIAICSYSLDKGRASDVIDIVSTHQSALIKQEGKWRVIESTERKKAEEKIKNLAKFPEENSNPVYRVSKDGVLLYANPASRRVIIEDQTKIGNKIPEKWIGMIKKVYDSGKRRQAELEFNGRIFLFNLVPVIKKGYVNSYAVDITERKKAEQEIKSLKEYNENIVAHIPNPLVVFDKDLKIISANNAFYQVYKEIPEKILGKTIREILPPEILSKVNFEKQILKVFKTGKTIEDLDFEYDSHYAGKKIMNIKYVPVLNWKAEEEHVMAIVDDVTERKRAGEKIKILSDAVENAYDATIVADLDGKIEYLNKAAERTYGYKKSELLGKKVTVLDVDPKKAKEILLRALKGGWSGEILARAKSGKRFPVLLSISPIKNEDGKIIATMGTSKDLAEITKLKKEKEVLTEKVVSLTKKIPLTEKEKLVLYGLVCWPELNDEQLSKRLKVKRPTVTAIKNKLKRQEFYSPHVVPNFAALGYELLSFVWGESSTATPLKEGKPKVSPITKMIESPECMYGVATDKEFMGLLVLKNFTEFKRINDSFSNLYRNYSAQEEKVHVAHFPFETTLLVPMFDCSLFLKNMFDLNIGGEKEKDIKKIAPASLTGREQTILYALTKWPGLNDSEIAKKINVARQTVSKTKHKLTSHGIMTLINKPNLKKLGCDLLINLYCKFNPEALKKGREEKIKEMNRIYPAVFRALAESECLSLSVFKNFVDYKTSYDKLIKYLREKNIAKEEQQVFMIPTEQIKLEKMDFATLVKKSL